MAKETEKKTNAVRALDAAKVDYVVRYAEYPSTYSGLQVAELFGQDPDSCFKTLVTRGKNNDIYVFMVPVACELDLKKAAQACGEKSIAMVKAKELLGLTGYVHGGCSPLGMKKLFWTAIDETAELYDTITFSGGKVGCQLEMTLDSLKSMIPIHVADITI